MQSNIKNLLSLFKKNRISLNEISNETRRNEHFMNDDELGYLVNSDLTDRVFFKEEQVNILNGYKDREIKNICTVSNGRNRHQRT